jgi:RNA polymerase sigma factor (TIGR02999 family)
MVAGMPSISSLIAAAERGDAEAGKALFAALYSELHRLAKRELGKHGFAVTLGVTTLLHEAYLDMAERSARAFPDEARFMEYAARVMRGLIIDHARHRRAVKRGGQFEFTTLHAEIIDRTVDERELAAISDSGRTMAPTAKESTRLAAATRRRTACC